ncbi:hypothetical protein CMV24_02080 [Pseudomonas plecoglossicida]|uniref:Uncharacterized protein n=1 Tax=Pseudomonas plecoglossicida TaxID=70775 RepID=A0A0B5KLQ9_PSEDL|nr:hypothetical protein [Pseudomonas plecoglossicida]AJG17310.1 hypothetical protein RK21_05802 [Pseudomonas plecoglossicida]PBJ97528.1 hypothetical protein CMV24_02080 [Pseudomonas plecoglossicida]
MTQILNPAQALPHRTGATIINGPWPTYTQFKGLPERERWTIYELAKAGRGAMEDNGFEMTESYDAFVRRITEELEL